MCIASCDPIRPVEDGPLISQGLREAASLCTREQATVAARMRLAAEVIDALLEKLASVEAQTRINKSTIENAIAESVPVVLPSMFDNIAPDDQPIESAYE